MARVVHDRVRVRVPATSANLGPGYDTLGVALSLYDEVTVRAIAGPTKVHVEGEGAGNVPSDDKHLVVQALRMGLEEVGAPQVGVEMHCTNHIPHGRGLGSSASAVVCGLLLARGLLDYPEALDDQAVLELATRVEGHPDNAAPAIFGGAVVSWTSQTGTHSVPIAVPESLIPTVFIPSFELATDKARALLPAQVPHADAAANAARAALLVLALQGRPEYLWEATSDRLHQDYREPAMPETLALVRWLRSMELPAVVSGAGPSAMVLGTVSPQVRREAESAGWRVLEMRVDTRGAVQLTA